MSRPAFKTQLFRFVDTFPAMDGDDDVLRHVGEYFDGAEVPRAPRLRRSTSPSTSRSARRLTASVARRNIARMADQFIVGPDARRGRRRPARAVAQGQRPHRRPPRREDRRRGRGRPLRGAGRRAHDDPVGRGGPLGARRPPRARRPRPAARGSTCRSSRPPSPPTSSRSPARSASPARRTGSGRSSRLAKEPRRPRPHRHGARRRQGPHAPARRASSSPSPSSADVHAGVVIQAYLKDSRDDLAEVIAWSAPRPVPLTVRLVKGAYWDTETVQARAEGWPVPVYERKVETDANFERCVRLLHDHHGEVRAAFGSHNLRSLAYAVAYARGRRHPRHRLRAADAARHGRAGPRRRPAARPPPPRLRPGRRARAGHGLPRAPPAREHLERELRPPPLRRGQGPRRAPRAARRRRPARARAGAAAPDDRRRRPDAVRPEPVAEWRRAWAAGADGRGGGAGGDRGDASTCPRSSAGEQVRTAATIDSVDPGDHEPRRRPRRRRAVPPRPTPRSPPRPRRSSRGRRRRSRSGPRAVPRRGVDAGAARRARRPRGVRGGQAVGPGRRRRVRGHRLLRVLRPGGAAPRRRGRRPGAVAAGGGEPPPLPGQGRRPSSSPRGTSRSPSRPA